MYCTVRQLAEAFTSGTMEQCTCSMWVNVSVFTKINCTPTDSFHTDAHTDAFAAFTLSAQHSLGGKSVEVFGGRLVLRENTSSPFLEKLIISLSRAHIKTRAMLSGGNTQTQGKRMNSAHLAASPSPCRDLRRPCVKQLSPPSAPFTFCQCAGLSRRE